MLKRSKRRSYNTNNNPVALTVLDPKTGTMGGLRVVACPVLPYSCHDISDFLSFRVRVKTDVNINVSNILTLTLLITQSSCTNNIDAKTETRVGRHVVSCRVHVISGFVSFQVRVKTHVNIKSNARGTK